MKCKIPNTVVIKPYDFPNWDSKSFNHGYELGFNAALSEKQIELGCPGQHHPLHKYTENDSIVLSINGFEYSFSDIGEALDFHKTYKDSIKLEKDEEPETPWAVTFSEEDIISEAIEMQERIKALEDFQQSMTPSDYYPEAWRSQMLEVKNYQFKLEERIHWIEEKIKCIDRHVSVNYGQTNKLLGE